LSARRRRETGGDRRVRIGDGGDRGRVSGRGIVVIATEGATGSTTESVIANGNDIPRTGMTATATVIVTATATGTVGEMTGSETATGTASANASTETETETGTTAGHR